MRPTPAVERIIQQTLRSGEPPFMALHARLEPEMLVHSKCRDQKVYNLTTILDMIRTSTRMMHHDVVFDELPRHHNNNNNNATMYIAIHVKEMQEGNPYRNFQLEHRLNMAALRDVMTNGLELPISGSSRRTLLQVLAAGVQLNQNDDAHMVDSCAHEIVSSVASFEIAVRAKIFIGTYISSWSYSVWKARHYMGYGRNYMYTPHGVRNITGVPSAFTC